MSIKFPGGICGINRSQAVMCMFKWIYNECNHVLSITIRHAPEWVFSLHDFSFYLECKRKYVWCVCDENWDEKFLICKTQKFCELYIVFYWGFSFYIPQKNRSQCNNTILEQATRTKCNYALCTIYIFDTNERQCSEIWICIYCFSLNKWNVKSAPSFLCLWNCCNFTFSKFNCDLFLSPLHCTALHKPRCLPCLLMSA